MEVFSAFKKEKKNPKFDKLSNFVITSYYQQGVPNCNFAFGDAEEESDPSTIK